MDEITPETFELMLGPRTVPPKAQQSEDFRLAEQILRENLPLAVEVIATIMRQSDSERNRMQAAKYIIDRNLGRIGEARPSDVDNPYEMFRGIMREPTAEERQSGRSVSRG